MKPTVILTAALLCGLSPISFAKPLKVFILAGPMSKAVIKTGIDLIDIDRLENVIERYGKRFLKRIFTPQELKDCGMKIPSLAVRFAAKEAVAKALGTGIGLISWQEIEIQRKETGEPLLKLYGKAEKEAIAQNLINWSISLSHTRSIAIAQVVATI